MSYPPLIDLRIGFWPVVHFIHPCSLFPIDNLSIYAQNFFEFCIHIVIGDERYGIVNGQNPTIFDGVTALSPFKKWFLACFSFTVYDIWMKLHRYVEQQRLHITKKDRHSYLSSSWVICPWLILSISVLLLFRHYISHKITFGAPSSGGVLCSACGAFIISEGFTQIWENHGKQLLSPGKIMGSWFFYLYHGKVTEFLKIIMESRKKSSGRVAFSLWDSGISQFGPKFWPTKCRNLAPSKSPRINSSGILGM